MPRFYDITAGKIFIDNVDIKAVTLDSLREQIGIVPQETMLFNGTVYDNIRYGNLQATRAEIEQAARDANAEKFILQLPNGYETTLGDRGVNLSGGQRQRIAIARAILKNPRIEIYKTHKRPYEALERTMLHEMVHYKVFLELTGTEIAAAFNAYNTENTDLFNKILYLENYAHENKWNSYITDINNKYNLKIG